ncbi:MAG: hypothetical protein C0418_05345, partial [Coriobacteriaceae bacterium]|nr:hypothetical protein [Coriobacteriaceae bacterium]
GDGSKLFRSMYLTAGGVWDHLWVFPIGISEDGGTGKIRNIIVLGTDADLAQAELLRRVESRVGGRVSVRDFAGFGEDLYTGIVPVADVPRLTDTHAPTDSLIKVQ